MFRQQPNNVWVLVEGVEVEIPFEQLKVGDTVVVDAGGLIPADGTITDGMASINQHLLTGESQPAEKGVGDPVFASTVVMSGRIYIQVEKAGEESIVAQIGQILNNTADLKSAMQLRTEVMADKTVLPTLAVSGLSLPFIGPNGAAAILNAHFKYKMGIVAPVGILNYLNLMSQNHILIKDGRTLDLLNQVDTVVFDKTGTLTEEQPYVGNIYTCSEYDENAVLTYAAAAEHKQTHPIARAIQKEAEGKFVCYVGDGINDAIALKKSQVSVSMRGASTVATDTAQIVLMDGSLNQLVRLFDIAREFKANMNVGFMTLLVPTIVGIAGAVFLHFGLAHTIILGYGGLTVGVLNGMRPMLKNQRKGLKNGSEGLVGLPSIRTEQPLSLPPPKETAHEIETRLAVTPSS